MFCMWNRSWDGTPLFIFSSQSTLYELSTSRILCRSKHVEHMSESITNISTCIVSLELSDSLISIFLPHMIVDW